ncbi:MAG TPA: valine--tRNA ligase [Longimicrobiales bacterium]
MSEPLSPQYDPGAIEPELYRRWHERGYFHAHAEPVLAGERSPYVIVIPPPNVTARLHMGHGLNNTLQDLLIRWRRMQGFEALWVPGSDHAGIATQNVVERELAREGKTRYDLGREAFVERVWAWVRETGATILEQLQAIGCSFDLSRNRFTLDPGLSRAVREVFVSLYEKGLIYRGNYIINWCPRCLTALSDEEAEAEETQGKLYYLRYPVVGGRERPGTGAGAGTFTFTGAGGSEDAHAHADAHGGDGEMGGGSYIVVATTRPETMLGDVAVAVHPEDPRYRDLVGAELELPLTGRRIPVVADDMVDPEFGTGAVKITPAHDPNDFELGRRHDLPALDVMTPEATMNETVPPPFRGLDRFEARQAVVEALDRLGLLEKVEEHAHTVPHCYRCDTVVEPRLSEQWFVRMRPLAEPALAASREGRLRFTPKSWTGVYEHWLENIRDWCISRQLWWGHRIPVWYCRADGCGETIAAREDPTHCPRCGGNELEQDPDVLDTWFSSALWPFSTLGWPDETRDLAAFYPTQTLVTGPDILFFWVARMVMMGLEFRGEVPFRDVLLNGMVRDHLRRKMSKSLGNGIDPLEVVQRFGADALRYTLIAGAAPGTDLYLNYENLEETFAPGRNFANKVWNIGRFALMRLEGRRVRRVEEVRDGLELADRWILSRLSAAAADVTRHLEAFRVHEAVAAVYRFLWSELADWYLELIKPRFTAEAEEASREAATATLAAALDGGLRLLHPFMPFISEALWLRLPVPDGVEREPSLVVARWPEPSAEWEDAEAEARLGALMELIGTVRTLRSEYGVPTGRKVEVRLSQAPEPLRVALAAEGRALESLAGVAEVVYGDARANGQAGAHAVLRGGAELFLPLSGIIDLERERGRLGAELDRLEAQLRATEARLANTNFVSKAPAEVVAREREKAASFRDQRDKLSRKLAALA